MFRFLLIALPLLIVVMGIFGLIQEMAPASGGPGLSPPQPVRDVGPRWRLAGWLVQAVALAALFLLVQGRAGAWWLDGLVSGWLAWVFRGPVHALTIVKWSRLPTGWWWQLSLRWFLLYSLCGFILAVIAHRSGLRRVPATEGAR